MSKRKKKTTYCISEKEYIWNPATCSCEKNI